MNKQILTLKQSVRILRRYQDWRRGDDCRTMDESGISPKALGEAIDVILKHHGVPKPLIRCGECVNHDKMFGGCAKMQSLDPKCVFKKRGSRCAKLNVEG